MHALHGFVVYKLCILVDSFLFSLYWLKMDELNWIRMRRICTL